MVRFATSFALVIIGALLAAETAFSQSDDALRSRAEAAMRKAATYYRTQVATRGGYVYHYSLDLQVAWGEGKASPTQIWVQPPGTPTVGLAYLAAWRATGDKFYLDAATDAADAIIYGQLKSGGWTNSVDFDPRSPQTAAYRNGKGRGKDNSTLDDGITQSAVRLLMRVDQAHDFKNDRIHQPVQIALAALLQAQFPNGGFPQVWTGPVQPQPVLQASFPDYDYRTEGKIKNYWDMYTLNDGLAGTVAATLADAYAIYNEPRYRQALTRLGDFLILAQLPQPQPAWAQQYSYQMHPIWARRFEPAAVAGGESQDVLETLMKIYELTGDRKYLKPIPAALAYLQRSRLPDGRLARYYELQTNRPLYMNRRGRDYFLTYDDSNLPDHYGWKIDSRLNDIEQQFKQISSTSEHSPAKDPAELATRAGEIIAALDDQGRWISRYDGQRLVGQAKFQLNEPYLSSAVFSSNLETLAEFLIASE